MYHQCIMVLLICPFALSQHLFSHFCHCSWSYLFHCCCCCCCLCYQSRCGPNTSYCRPLCVSVSYYTYSHFRWHIYNLLFPNNIMSKAIWEVQASGHCMAHYVASTYTLINVSHIMPWMHECVFTQKHGLFHITLHRNVIYT